MQDDRYSETLNAQVLLGEQADKFFKSELGQRVLGRVLEQVEDNVERLKNADPTDTKEIIRLQSAIKVAEAVPKYFAELIQEGHQALQIMDEGE